MENTHHHHHGHHHHGDVSNIQVAFFLNFGFTIVEIVGGILTNSVAILSDALHDFGDTLSLGMAWYFQKLSKKDSDKTFSYGYSRFSLLGAIINGMVLIVGAIFILMETIPRLMHPETPDAQGMIGLAILGILVNGAAVFRLNKGTSINERVVALHLLEDMLGWIAVLIGAIVMTFYDVPIIDPILSLCIALFMLYNVFKNLKSTFKIILQSVPTNIDRTKIEAYFSNHPKIAEYHDLHIWSLDGEYNILTVHLVQNAHFSDDERCKIKADIRHDLQHMHIEHATLEFELEGEVCGFENC